MRCEPLSMVEYIFPIVSHTVCKTIKIITFLVLIHGITKQLTCSELCRNIKALDCSAALIPLPLGFLNVMWVGGSGVMTQRHLLQPSNRAGERRGGLYKLAPLTG